MLTSYSGGSSGGPMRMSSSPLPAQIVSHPLTVVPLSTNVLLPLPKLTDNEPQIVTLGLPSVGVSCNAFIVGANASSSPSKSGPKLTSSSPRPAQTDSYPFTVVELCSNSLFPSPKLTENEP